MNKTKKGFTLIELIVVLAILAVIAAIAIPTAFGSIEKAKEAADQASIDGFNSAVRMQATLLTANYVAADNTVGTAVKNAGLEKSTATIQAKATLSHVAYVKPATGTNTPGYFIIYTGTTPAGATDVATAANPGQTWISVLNSATVSPYPVIDHT